MPYAKRTLASLSADMLQKNVTKQLTYPACSTQKLGGWHSIGWFAGIVARVFGRGFGYLEMRFRSGVPANEPSGHLTALGSSLEGNPAPGWSKHPNSPVSIIVDHHIVVVPKDISETSKKVVKITQFLFHASHKMSRGLQVTLLLLFLRPLLYTPMGRVNNNKTITITITACHLLWWCWSFFDDTNQRDFWSSVDVIFVSSQYECFWSDNFELNFSWNYSRICGYL